MSQQVYLECINPANSEYKYWRAWIDSVTYTIHTNWGRIDAPRGQSKAYAFANLSQAQAKLESLVRLKLKKGYQDKSAPPSKPPVAPHKPSVSMDNKKNALNPFGTGKEVTRPSRKNLDAEAHTAHLLLQTLHSLLDTNAPHATFKTVVKDFIELYPQCASYLTLPLSEAQLQQCADLLNLPPNN